MQPLCNAVFDVWFHHRLSPPRSHHPTSSCVTALVFIMNLTLRRGRALPSCGTGLRVRKDTQHEAQGVHVCVDRIKRQQYSCVHVLRVHNAFQRACV